MSSRIITGNSLEKLRDLGDESIHCTVSSPPYWGLRDYSIESTIWGGSDDCAHTFIDETIEREIRTGLGLEELSKRYRGGGKKQGKIEPFRITRGSCIHCGAWRGNLGLEPNPDMFVQHLVLVFEEVRRVTRRDGSLWLNLGDSYATGAGAVGERPGGGVQGDNWKGAMTSPNRMPIPGLKPKDLVGAPWMAAFALRRAGWYLRSDVIWHKPNPMPESTEDRPTKSHEYLFLFSKEEQYFYDGEAIKEEAIYGGEDRPTFRGGAYVNGAMFDNSGEGGKSTVVGNIKRRRKEALKGSFLGKRENADNIEMEKPFRAIREKRNKRTVWTVATQPFENAHFATFPPDLIEPCIKASTSERGCCRKCAAPFERITAPTDRYLEYLGRSYHEGVPAEDRAERGMMASRGINRQNIMLDDGIVSKETDTLGWYPTCACYGIPELPKLPQSPRRKGMSDADLEQVRAAWREECRAVFAVWRKLCQQTEGLPTKPAVVLDPFGGAGTTALVADRLQRDSVSIELNPRYAEMARERVVGDAPLFAAAE